MASTSRACSFTERNGTAAAQPHEGLDGCVKDPAHEPRRRRLNGLAAQSILTALLLLAANVQKIRTYLEEGAVRTAPDASGRAPVNAEPVRSTLG